MKKPILILTILASFIFTACSRDAEVNAFISESDKLANDIVQKVKGNPTAAGVDEAQKILDGKKADLHARYEGFQSRGFQVKSETMKNLTDSKSRNLLSVNGLRVDLMNKMTSDKALSNKVDKLVNDYNALFGGG